MAPFMRSPTCAEGVESGKVVAFSLNHNDEALKTTSCLPASSLYALFIDRAVLIRAPPRGEP